MNIRPSITVVLADDHAMVRESLARVLNTSGRINVVAQTGDSRELAALIDEYQPACLVLDYSMPEHDPPAVIGLLLARCPKLKILVLTVHENVHYAVRVLEAGAHGYLIKSAAVEELVEAIETVHDGDVYISKKITREVWAQLRRPKRSREGVAALSQREFEVLRILGAGATLQECVEQLDVSYSSVSTYRARLLEKLHLNSTAELIRFAIENQIVG